MSEAIALSPAASALSWWSSLTHPHVSGPQRADRARLRGLRTHIDPVEGRVFASADAWMTGSFWDLRKKLPGWRGSNETLAIIASLLAQVKDNVGSDHPGRLLHAAGVPESRFRRIIAAETLVDLHAPLTQALAQANSRIAIEPLARDLLAWSPATRRRWAENYWSAYHSKSSEQEPAA